MSLARSFGVPSHYSRGASGEKSSKPRADDEWTMTTLLRESLHSVSSGQSALPLVSSENAFSTRVSGSGLFVPRLARQSRISWIQISIAVSPMLSYKAWRLSFSSTDRPSAQELESAGPLQFLSKQNTSWLTPNNQQLQPLSRGRLHCRSI